ncbi:hypothetical protein ERJ70_12755 [Sediminibacillus dalangtanensis]|uniref:Uncharacterized protein n=1 Tax=Sediminibacillus dalangtanensis TaxID=2729421 RepID=A0ABX7VWE5_9BACI|nr:hypothetical protein [Sediminibacillus dalangtanensis]QTN00091.1 hypothetical protein ERJ70_12755 [Sediminibacillus dalangtanensis]
MKKISWLIGILTVTALLLWAATAVLIWEDLQQENDSRLSGKHPLAKRMDRELDGIGLFTKRSSTEIKSNETNHERPVISIDELLSDLHIDPK